MVQSQLEDDTTILEDVYTSIIVAVYVHIDVKLGLCKNKFHSFGSG